MAESIPGATSEVEQSKRGGPTAADSQPISPQIGQQQLNPSSIASPVEGEGVKGNELAFRTEASAAGLANSGYKSEQYLESDRRRPYMLFRRKLQLSMATDGARMARKALLLAGRCCKARRRSCLGPATSQQRPRWGGLPCNLGG